VAKIKNEEGKMNGSFLMVNKSTGDKFEVLVGECSLLPN
jgi:uncharacterized protein affecting Mg2+/Co2+ transport